MTWRLRVPGVVIVLLVLFALALALGANWIEGQSATDGAGLFSDWAADL